MDQFPSNSRSNREATPEKEEVKSIVKGTVTLRKKSLGRKFVEIFVGDGADRGGILKYMVEDVLVPYAQDAVVEAFKGGIDQAIYGGGRGGRSAGRGRMGGRTDYSEISRRGSTISRRDDTRRESSRGGGVVRDFEQVVLGNRAEAFEVLDEMYARLEKYKIVTVAELYGLVGRRSTHIEQDWGWEELRGSDVQHIRDGFLLNLPQPERID